MASQISNNDRHKLAQLGASRKRKDRDRLDADAIAEPTPLPAKAQQPACDGGNRLLAGYLAHEFLTKGTLFGKHWGHAAHAAPAARPLAPPRPQPEAKEPIQQPQVKPGKPPMAYAEVAELLKTEGAHVPGVVNPTQLAWWLQL